MARDTIVLTRSDLAGKIDFARAIDVIETCLAEHEKGEDLMPPKLILEIGGGIAACLAGYTKAQHALTMKNGQERKSNRERGLPTIHVHVFLYDPDTGELLMITEGLLPTVMRTGSAAAVAARHLARPDAKVGTVVGAGQLGRQAAQAMLCVRELERLFICDSYAPAQAELVEQLADLTDAEVLAAKPGEAVPQSDLIFTCTNSTEPIVEAAWIKAGTHLSCMGADLADKQEVEPALLPKCRLFADNVDQCTSRGEVSKAVAAGVLPAQPFIGTLGQVINGALPGRLSNDDITLYDGTGLGVQDTAMATVIYEIAQRDGLGQRLCFEA